MHNNDIPHGIAGHIVHPARKRRFLPDKIQTFLHRIVLSEYRLDRCNLRMHVAYPDKAVPLDSVPDIFLHIQMNRISAHIPDPVQQWIAAGKASPVRNILIDHDRTDALDHQYSLRLQKINPHKTETRFSNGIHAHHSDFHHQISSGVVVRGIGLTPQFTHGLRCGFPEADPDLCPSFGAVQPGQKRDSSMDLDSIIQKDGGLLSFFIFQNTGLVSRQRNLHFLFFQKPPAVFYLSCGPENPLRKKKASGSDIFLAVFQGLFIQNPKNIVSFPFIHLFLLYF